MACAGTCMLGGYKAWYEQTQLRQTVVNSLAKLKIKSKAQLIYLFKKPFLTPLAFDIYV